MVGKKRLEPSEAFGRALRQQRKERGFSQERLAMDAGVQRNYVSLLELGRNQPTISIIFKLADALSIRPSKLLQLTEDQLSGSD
jgi:transcriptional regulator with XRE-family HTH domain